ncbi:ATP-binding protein [Streptomyces laurentii]|uniref:ATP-binding protein n=1 Tax=Streptomyces laurentii TaxID=39478 RepID=UPI0036B8859C
MSIWWSFHLRRDAASVPLARRLLLGAMETAGVDPDVSYELSVALTEACANAVEHGGRPLNGTVDAPRAGEEYRVTAYLDGETCRIEVADSGPGFPGAPGRSRGWLPTPAAPDAESGRGLRLIEELADHVHFGRTGRGGALVSFDKIVKWRADAPLALA